VDTLK
jgi:hypothetical protein